MHETLLGIIKQLFSIARFQISETFNLRNLLEFVIIKTVRKTLKKIQII